ncbi:MAG TPA: Ku protein [Actinomycetota bacterium]|jgi:DNA end-binding protein Ku|nr:Ku protein [Actinomycetota bacterium]
MPTAVWTGSLSFGLVNVPVRLINATEPKDVRFHLYDRSGRRVRYERVVDAPEAVEEPVEPDGSAETEAIENDVAEPRPASAEPPASTSRSVEWEDVVRGRENELGEVVTLSREELEQVRPERSRTIDIEDFVELADIDPVSFEKTYYAIPSPESAKTYALLHRAMREAGRVGIGRFVLRTKPHLVAVRPMHQVLAVETLFFGDEVRDPAALAPDLGGVEVEERELDLAVRLIDTLTTQWNPAAYADSYREELLRILSEKSPTAPAAPEPAAGASGGPSAVEELMAALRESVEQAKSRKRPRSRSKKAG